MVICRPQRSFASSRRRNPGYGEGSKRQFEWACKSAYNGNCLYMGSAPILTISQGCKSLALRQFYMYKLKGHGGRSNFNGVSWHVSTRTHAISNIAHGMLCPICTYVNMCICVDETTAHAHIPAVSWWHNEEQRGHIIASKTKAHFSARYFV